MLPKKARDFQDKDIPNTAEGKEIRSLKHCDALGAQCVMSAGCANAT